MLTSLPATFAPSRGRCPKCNGMAWFFGPMNATGRNATRDPCPACSASGRSHPSLRDTKILVEGILDAMPGSKDRAAAILGRLKHRVSMVGASAIQHTCLLAFALTMVRIDLTLLAKAGYAAEIVTACEVLQEAVGCEKDMLLRAARIAAAGDDLAVAAASMLNEVKPPPGAEAAAVRRALRPEWLILNAVDFGVVIQPDKNGNWVVTSRKGGKQATSCVVEQRDEGGWGVAGQDAYSMLVDVLDQAIARVRPVAEAA